MALPSNTELQAIAKFHQRLEDLNIDSFEEDRDFLLLRFLRARDFNLNKAEDMLRKHLQWKVENKICEILDWVPPSVLTNDYPYEICGFDREGCPVLVVPFGVWDVRKICETGLKSDYVRYVDQLFMKVNKAMVQSSKVNGKRVSQFVGVFIPDNLPAFRQMSCAAAVDAVLETVHRFEANYPETLKAAFVVDTPRVFQLIFSVVKPLLNSTTLGKVTISSNPKDWKPALINLINEDQLPGRLGGSRPSLIQNLNEGKGSVSVSDEDERSFIALTIPAGQRAAVQCDIDQDQTQITWAFKTDNNDIGFQILFDGTEVVVPYSRLNSHREVQCGGHRCNKSGRYVIQFDNTFSRWRAKVVRYRLVMEHGVEVEGPAHFDTEDPRETAQQVELASISL